MANGRTGPECPGDLGIDEHFFTRRQGCVTTFCDVVFGRPELSLEGYLGKR